MSKSCVVLGLKVKATRRLSPVAHLWYASLPAGGLTKEAVVKVCVLEKTDKEKAGKAYGKIRDFGKLEKEEWRNDGSWIGIIKIPAGLQGDFYSLLNTLTKGEAETKVIE